ncbi:HutD family protein [Streptomyces sp. NPDC048638]|uniref:HutD/Ves family protein n=1 Tax=Streptomyces sp. NPDC048638 TaxID=3365580 RepID=UPI003723A498
MTGEGAGDGAVRILRAEGRAAAPWSNGGGVTREIAVHPPGADWDGFDWRVSLADVTRDGPYSPLPGVRRILTVVDGGGLALTVDGAPRLLPDRFRPFAFSGGAVTDCRLLDGPVVNLNVMVREGRARAVVEMVRGSRAVPPGDALVVAVEGSAQLAAPGEPGVRLARFDAAVVAAGARCEVRTAGVAAVIALSAGGDDG